MKRTQERWMDIQYQDRLLDGKFDFVLRLIVAILDHGPQRTESAGGGRLLGYAKVHGRRCGVASRPTAVLAIMVCRPSSDRNRRDHPESLCRACVQCWPLSRRLQVSLHDLSSQTEEISALSDRSSSMGCAIPSQPSWAASAFRRVFRNPERIKETGVCRSRRVVQNISQAGKHRLLWEVSPPESARTAI